MFGDFCVFSPIFSPWFKSLIPSRTPSSFSPSRTFPGGRRRRRCFFMSRRPSSIFARRLSFDGLLGQQFISLLRRPFITFPCSFVATFSYLWHFSPLNPMLSIIVGCVLASLLDREGVSVGQSVHWLVALSVRKSVHLISFLEMGFSC